MVTMTELGIDLTSGSACQSIYLCSQTIDDKSSVQVVCILTAKI